MRSGKKATVAGIALLAMTLAACGGSGSHSGSGGHGKQQSNEKNVPADYNPQPRDKVKDGGSWKGAVGEVPTQLNTFQADSIAYTGQLWTWYNPQMVFFSPEGKPSFNKDYLKDVQQKTEHGNTVITYTLNPKAKWNDGKPITWESYKLTARANSGKDKRYQPDSTVGYDRIKSVAKGKNDRQAVVTFDGTYAWWEGLFQKIVHPHLKDPKVFNKAYVNKPHPEWGAGPFTVDKFDHKNGVITFKRNPKWWGHKPKLDKVTLKQMEPSAQMNAFQNGEIDAADVGVSKDYVARAKKMKDVTLHRAGRTQMDLLMLQGKSPKLKDLKVRKAILEGIDRRVLQKIEFQGLSYREKPPGSFLLYPFQDGYRDNLKQAGYKSSTKEANKLLDQAGWKKGSDGVRAKNGKKLRLRAPLIGDDPTKEAEAKAVQSMLKKIGAKYEIQKKPNSDFAKVLQSDNWEVFTLGLTPSGPFGGATFCDKYCSDGDQQKRSHTVPKKFDKKIAALQDIGDKKKQLAKGNRLETQIIKSSWGMFPTINGPKIYATKKGAANIGPEPYNTGPDLFGVHPVEDVGWQQGKSGKS